MDIQFHGANCVSVSVKQTRIVIDDNLSDLGLSKAIRPDDIALYTSKEEKQDPKASLVIDLPGEYEVGDVSVFGIAARSHVDEAGTLNSTIFKIIANDISLLVLGHIYPELSDDELENIGVVDVLFVPVGGHGYTLDAQGALKMIRGIAPKIVVPTHYEDKDIKYPVPQEGLDEAIKILAMEPKERVAKLKLKVADLTDTTQLIILERS
jgi:L-ascorbate metabolism protein UlaG (beta-lactamase superfamily)